MNDLYTYIADVGEQDIPEDGILSRTLYDNDRVKVVVFAFGAGQELTEHTASMPALLSITKGHAELKLGSDTIDAHAGAWAYMPAHLRHAVRAKTPMVMLLTLLKQS